MQDVHNQRTLTNVTYGTFTLAFEALQAAGYKHKNAGKVTDAHFPWRYEYGLCEARIDYSKQHGGYRITERA